VQVGVVQEDLSQLSMDELALRAEVLLHQLCEAKELQEELALSPYASQASLNAHASQEVLEVIDTTSCASHDINEVLDDDARRGDTLQGVPQIVHEHGMRDVQRAAEAGTSEETQEDT